VRHLFPAGRPIQLDKQVGRSQIAIVLDDLVFEDQVIPESIPGQFGDQPVVLVQVVTVVREDDIGSKGAFQVLEGVLDVRPDVREVPIPEPFHDDCLLRSFAQEQVRAVGGFIRSCGVCAEDEPIDFEARPFVEQAQDCPPAANLDVVAVRPEKQKSPGLLLPVGEKERKHIQSFERKTREALTKADSHKRHKKHKRLIFLGRRAKL
jgi:hypothetical protein